MRSGGATAAANANVPDHIFKRHGRWKSENAKDGYGLENQLEVSRKIGLYLQCNTLFVALVYQQPTAVLAQPHWVREYMHVWWGVWCSQGMMWEMYFLVVECSELDRK